MAKGGNTGGPGGGGSGGGTKNTLTAVDDYVQFTESMILYTGFFFSNDIAPRGTVITGIQVGGSSDIYSTTNDLDSDPTTITVLGQYGTLVVYETGQYNYYVDSAGVQSLADGEEILETFTYYAADPKGNTASADLTFSILGLNDAPTSIKVNGGYTPSVNENESVGTVVGTLTAVDVDASDTHTFSLLNGVYDNNLFEIVGNELRTKASFDYESQAIYTIYVQADDGHGGVVSQGMNVRINNVNDAPTDIKIDGMYSDSVDENLPAWTIVGILTADDPDAGSSHTFSLVAGAGDTDNGLFDIVGNKLYTKQLFNYETQGPLSIRVQANDGLGGTVEKTLTININDVNDAPSDIKIDGMSSAAVDENAGADIVLGTLTAIDPDIGDSHTFSLVAGAGDTDNSGFEVVGNELRTLQSFDFEAKGILSIRVQADDGQGGVTAKTLIINVNDINESPTDIKIDGMSSDSVDENMPVGTAVGILTADDPDIGDSHSFTLVAGSGDTDNARFEIVGNELRTLESFDFETQGPLSILVQADDGQGGTFTKSLAISINDVIEQLTAVDDVHILDARVTDSSDGSQAEAIPVVLQDGSSVIVWVGDNEIYARHFDVDGVAIGDEFVVNASTTGYEGWPYACALPDGGFVVVWTDYGQTANNIRARVFNADETPRGDDIHVGAANGGYSPYVAAVGNSFLVVWQESSGDAGIHARQFSSAGFPETDAFLVNSSMPASQDLPSVTGLVGGGYVFSWEAMADTNNDGTADTVCVFTRQFDASGNPLTSDVMVNDIGSVGNSWSKVAALSDGGYVVVWQGDALQGDGIDIYGRVFDADGQAGSQFVVNSTMALDQANPSAQALSDGGFVVVWGGNGEDSSGATLDDAGIFGQRFDSTGSMVGPEFQVNVDTAGNQGFPFISAYDDDTLLVSWDAYDSINFDNDVFSIHIDANGGTESIIQVIDVLANDVDPVGSTLSITSLYFTDPDIAATDASLAVRADNKVVFNPGTAFEHLDTGESVDVQFSYTIDDGNGQTADALATVTVLGSYDEPPMV